MGRFGRGAVHPLLTFSTVDWSYLWHRPQEVMSRFAAQGWPVAYVDTVGVRQPTLSDFRPILSRLRNWACLSAPRRTAGVRVVSPLQLPVADSRLACRLNGAWLRGRVTSCLAELGGGLPIVWVYLPTRTVLQCIRRVPRRLLVYEAIDDLAGNPRGVSEGFIEAEAEIASTADLVLTSSESLYLQKRRLNANTHWVASGVHERFFGVHAVAPEVQAVPAPRIGFFGTIDHRLDLDLVRTLAAEHADWSFVLIGPAHLRIKSLLRLSNIHWLGRKPHESLPGYVAGLDAILLPYVVDRFTAHVYPAKVHECLALGIPVVATALPSLEPFGEFIHLVRPGESFGQALQLALGEADEGLRERRTSRAQSNSWGVRFAEIRAHVDAALQATRR